MSMSWSPSNTHFLTNGSLNFGMKNRLPSWSGILTRIRQKFLPLINKPGVHSSIYLKAAGFQYTGIGDTARCDACNLEVSGWTLDMKPWVIHSTRNPECPFVRRLRAEAFSNAFSSLCQPTTAKRNTAEQGNPSKRRKTEIIDLESPSNTSVEADLFQEARRRTFSDWSYPSTSIEDLIKAGFCACNVGDRVMCIHCNIICHRWTPHVDEPCEVHKAISPHCPYVKEKLLSGEQPGIVNNNQNSTNALSSNHLSTRNSTHAFRFNNLLRPPDKNGRNSNASRQSTVSSAMPIGEMIRQDSFYPRIKHDETCSECKKSLQNMGPCDNEMADCAHWFVHCSHTKPYTAKQVYDQIQKSKQQQRRRPEGHTGSDGTSNTNPPGLDLRIPQQLLYQDFSLSILQRIWGNELQPKPDDSIYDVHLLLACAIFQKQIDYIDGKQEKIVTPGVKMQEMTEQAKKEEAEKSVQRQAVAQANNSTPPDPCVLCVMKEKQLACLPCGHRAICVPCSQSLRSCPICRREITKFVLVFT